MESPLIMILFLSILNFYSLLSSVITKSKSIYFNSNPLAYYEAGMYPIAYIYSPVKLSTLNIKKMQYLVFKVPNKKNLIFLDVFTRDKLDAPYAWFTNEDSGEMQGVIYSEPQSNSLEIPLLYAYNLNSIFVINPNEYESTKWKLLFQFPNIRNIKKVIAVRFGIVYLETNSRNLFFIKDGSNKDNLIISESDKTYLDLNFANFKILDIDYDPVNSDIYFVIEKKIMVFSFFSYKIRLVLIAVGDPSECELDSVRVLRNSNFGATLRVIGICKEKGIITSWIPPATLDQRENPYRAFEKTIQIDSITDYDTILENLFVVFLTVNQNNAMKIVACSCDLMICYINTLDMIQFDNRIDLGIIGKIDNTDVFFIFSKSASNSINRKYSLFMQSDEYFCNDNMVFYPHFNGCSYYCDEKTSKYTYNYPYCTPNLGNLQICSSYYSNNIKSCQYCRENYIKVDLGSITNCLPPKINSAGMYEYYDEILKTKKLCDSNCDQCMGGGPKKCINCRSQKPFFDLKDTTCYETCPISTEVFAKTCVRKTNDCNTGFIFVNNNCENCNARCLTCDSDKKTCLKCYPGDALLNGDCKTECDVGYFKNLNENNVFICDKCSDKCKTCVDASISCISCNTPLLLYENTHVCIEKCPEGTLLNANGCFLICHDLQAPYYIPSINDCKVTCPEGTKEINDDIFQIRKCVICPQQCELCPKNSSICEKCLPNNYLTADGRCSNDCPEGYIKKTDPLNVCVPCDGCKTCINDPKKCLTCLNDNNYLYLGKCYDNCPERTMSNMGSVIPKTCTKCEDSCKNCEGTFDSCSSCDKTVYYHYPNLSKCMLVCPINDGYYAFIDSSVKECRKCIDNCLVCDSKETCETCKNNYYLSTNKKLCDLNCLQYEFKKDGICSLCLSPCGNCLGKEDYCTSCFDSTYILFNNKCIHNCPPSYYKDSQSGCLPCTVQNCDLCEGNICSACLQNYYLFKNLCYLGACPDHTLQLDGKCETCAQTTCLQCKTAISNCILCEDPYNVNDGECLSDCPIEKIPNGNGQCVDCPVLVDTIGKKCVSACSTGTYLSKNLCLKCQFMNCDSCTATECIKCIISFYLSTSKTACVKNCPINEYIDATNNLCVKCDISCEECSSFNVCTNCNKDYFLTGSKKCVKDCGEGFYGFEGKCYSCDKICKTCKEKSNYCTTCNENFELIINENTCKCLPTFILKENYCVPCSVANCHKCTNEKTCDKCADPYFLESSQTKCLLDCGESFYSVEGKCENCDKICKNCKERSNNCISCHENFELNIENSCQCKPYYFLRENECIHCIQNCLNCLDDKTCLKCSSSHILNSASECDTSCLQTEYIKQIDSTTKKCEKCSSECKSCETTNANCKSCFPGKFLSQVDSFESRCFDCVNTCELCNSLIECTKCKEPYSLNPVFTCVETCDQSYFSELSSIEGKVCKKCMDNCIKCSKANECEECLDKYLLDSNKKCVCQCWENEYLDGKTCKKCPDNCRKCVNSLKCTECYKNYKLENDNCLALTNKKCGIGVFQEVNSNICVPCKDICVDCEKDVSNCIKCKPEQYLYYDNIADSLIPCLDKCPSNNIIVERDGEKYCMACSLSKCHKLINEKCVEIAPISCHESCLTCTGPLINECLTCFNGTYLYENNCVSKCPSMYKIDPLKTKCIQCEKSEIDCLICDFSEYKYNMTCVKNCPTGYYENHEKKICQICTEDVIGCKFCENNMYLFNKTCVKKCPIGYSEDKRTMKCTNCSLLTLNCAFCTSQKCLQCLDPYILNSTNCIKSCLESEYYDEFDLICSKCHSNCSTCFGPDPTNCNSCKPPLFLKGIECKEIISDDSVLVITLRKSKTNPNEFYIEFSKKVPIPNYVNLNALIDIAIPDVPLEMYNYQVSRTIDEKLLQVSLSFNESVKDPLISLSLSNYSKNFIIEGPKNNVQFNQSTYNISLDSIIVPKENKNSVDTKKKATSNTFESITYSICIMLIITFIFNSKRISYFWYLCDAMQLFALVLFMKLNYLERLVDFFRKLFIYHANFIIFLGKDYNSEGQLSYFGHIVVEPDDKSNAFKYLGTYSFLVNGFQAFCVILLCYVVLIFLKIFFKVNDKFFKMDESYGITGILRYFYDFTAFSALIRINIFFFYIITYSAFLQIYHFNLSNNFDKYSLILSLISLLYYLIFFMVLSKKIINNKEKYDDEDERLIYDSIFNGLETSNALQRNHILFIQIKKFFIVVCLVTTTKDAETFIYLLLLLQFLSIIRYIRLRPFQTKFLNLLTFLTEVWIFIIVCVLFKLSSITKIQDSGAFKLSDDSLEEMENSGDAIIILIFVLIGCYFAISAILFVFYCLKNLECLCFFFFHTKPNIIDEIEKYEEENKSPTNDEEEKYKIPHKKDIRDFAIEVNQKKKEMEENKKKDIVKVL